MAEAAYRRYHSLIHQDGAVQGGPERAVRTPAAWAALQMGTDAEPACWLIHASGDQRARWEGEVRGDLIPMRFPIREDGASDLRGRAYTLVVLRDRPEVRALVRYLLGADFAPRLVRHDTGSGLVPLASQDEPIDRPTGERIASGLVGAALSAGTFRVDASDRMPRALGAVAFPESALRVAQAPPGTSDNVIANELASLEQIRVAAFP